MAKYKVSGALVASNGLMLFLMDGAPVFISSADHKTKAMAEAVMTPLAKNGPPIEIDTDDFTIAKDVNKALKDTGVKMTENEGKLAIKVDNKVVLADASAITKHVERAAYGEGAKGFAEFMRRVAATPRKHSVQDLLKFLEHGDLPIADDGKIVAYKVLKHKEGDVYVDVHSKQVRQRIGSRVTMPEALVNVNRSQSCEQGLHICSRGYLSGFSSDAVFLTVVDPADILTVPHNEWTKVRGAGYDIVAKLDDDDYQALRNGTPIYDRPKAKAILEKIIAGDRPPIIEVVEVGAEGAHEVKPLEKPEVATKTKVRPVSFGEKKAAKLTPLDPGSFKRQIAAAKSAATTVVEKMIGGMNAARQKAFNAKLRQAFKLIDKGESIRTVSKQVGIDRDALSKAIKNRT